MCEIRFLGAKANGLGEQLSVLADLHNLTYTQQCFFVDRLRAMVHEYGTHNASTLLLLSGRCVATTVPTRPLRHCACCCNS